MSLDQSHAKDLNMHGCNETLFSADSYTVLYKKLCSLATKTRLHKWECAHGHTQTIPYFQQIPLLFP